jgi:hypothetical protein
LNAFCQPFPTHRCFSKASFIGDEKGKGGNR